MAKKLNQYVTFQNREEGYSQTFGPDDELPGWVNLDGVGPEFFEGGEVGSDADLPVAGPGQVAGEGLSEEEKAEARKKADRERKAKQRADAKTKAEADAEAVKAAEKAEADRKAAEESAQQGGS